MPRASALALVALAACGGGGGSWPSLAPRAIETLRLDSAPAAVPVPSPVPDPGPPPAPPVDPAAPATWARLERRVAPELAALAAAVRAARGARSGSEPWAAAQVAISRAGGLDDELAAAALGFGETPAGETLAPPALVAARARLRAALDGARAVTAP